MESMKDRSDYKRTWEALSQSMAEAMTFVSGSTDEAEYERSAKHTIDVLERTVGLKSTDTLLEIGCGVGRTGKLLSGRCRKWIGTDISGNMLEYAAKRLQGLHNVELVELHSVGLDPIASDSVDMVYCTVVFMHLLEWDRFKYVQEGYRVLRPGGRAFFDNVDITSSHGWKVFTDGLAYQPLHRPAHLSMVSSGDELETYAVKAGFEQVQVHRWDDAWVGVTGVKPAAR
jgi:ubiquinone/menaquinone biosynthesis C-methylase UbiE